MTPDWAKIATIHYGRLVKIGKGAGGVLASMTGRGTKTEVDDRLGLDALVFIRNIATAEPKTTESEYGQTAEHMVERAQTFLKEHGLS